MSDKTHEATALDRVLASIHPSGITEPLHRRADDALSSFDYNAALIRDWPCFRDASARFLQHAECRLLNLRTAPRMPVSNAWERCVAIFLKAYGPDGEKVAFELARTGTENGFYGVCKRIAAHLAEEYALNHIRANCSLYWDMLSADEKLAAGEEFLRKYGHLLPSELTEGSAMRVRANLPQFLEKYPQFVRRLGQIGRG